MEEFRETLTRCETRVHPHKYTINIVTNRVQPQERVQSCITRVETGHRYEGGVQPRGITAFIGREGKAGLERESRVRCLVYSAESNTLHRFSEDALMTASNNVTEALQRTIGLMQGELERSVLSSQLLGRLPSLSSSQPLVLTNPQNNPPPH